MCSREAERQVDIYKGRILFTNVCSSKYLNRCKMNGVTENHKGASLDNNPRNMQESCELRLEVEKKNASYGIVSSLNYRSIILFSPLYRKL